MSLVTKILPINEADNIGQFSTKDLNLHDCLSDNADWNNEYWEFDSKCIKKIEKEINNAYALSTKGIKFQAIWVGEKPNNTIELTIEALFNAFSSNKIGTHSIYVVSKNA